MKTPKHTGISQKLIHEIQLARLRLAKAGNQWKSAREQARLAKRRRKEAKEAARRAKKQAKQAKADLAEARKVLAKAEAKLDTSGARLVARKPARAKARRRAKRIVAVPRRKPAPAREDQPMPSATSPVTGSVPSVPADSNPANPGDL